MSEVATDRVRVAEKQTAPKLCALVLLARPARSVARSAVRRVAARNGDDDLLSIEKKERKAFFKHKKREGKRRLFGALRAMSRRVTT